MVHSIIYESNTQHYATASSAIYTIRYLLHVIQKKGNSKLHRNCTGTKQTKHTHLHYFFVGLGIRVPRCDIAAAAVTPLLERSGLDLTINGASRLDVPIALMADVGSVALLRPSCFPASECVLFAAGDLPLTSRLRRGRVNDSRFSTERRLRVMMLFWMNSCAMAPRVRCPMLATELVADCTPVDGRAVSLLPGL